MSEATDELRRRGLRKALADARAAIVNVRHDHRPGHDCAPCSVRALEIVVQAKEAERETP